MDKNENRSKARSMRAKCTNVSEKMTTFEEAVMHVATMDGPKRMQLLLKQLELASLQAAHAVLQCLNRINDSGTSEAAREVLINQLLKLASFGESATIQRLHLYRAFQENAPTHDSAQTAAEGESSLQPSSSLKKPN